MFFFGFLVFISYICIDLLNLNLDYYDIAQYRLLNNSHTDCRMLFRMRIFRHGHY